jgi:probable rRNA maturation factor
MLSAARPKIFFHFLVKPFTLRNRTLLKRFIERQLKREGKTVGAINYIFCDDDYLLQLNKTHLKHNTLTDIITFELSLKGEPLISDIYISVQRIRENSTVFKQPFHKELHRVIFHGALHLAGYKDKTPVDAASMRDKEEQYLRSYFVPRGTLKRKQL